MLKLTSGNVKKKIPPDTRFRGGACVPDFGIVTLIYAGYAPHGTAPDGASVAIKPQMKYKFNNRNALANKR